MFFSLFIGDWWGKTCGMQTEDYGVGEHTLDAFEMYLCGKSKCNISPADRALPILAVVVVATAVSAAVTVGIL